MKTNKKRFKIKSVIRLEKGQAAMVIDSNSDPIVYLPNEDKGTMTVASILMAAIGTMLLGQLPSSKQLVDTIVAEFAEKGKEKHESAPQN